ncbi:hypothetical protein RRG08_005850 [Elysia crispata]|uniref:Uncharacterized protein n=1 Tax=Elysia crispata TaxID=231223 RepID=A0AAE1DQ50_9GAST|nr:hypothetical protein RRG08_005850 [Elysia crispata]
MEQGKSLNLSPDNTFADKPEITKGKRPLRSLDCSQENSSQKVVNLNLTPLEWNWTGSQPPTQPKIQTKPLSESTQLQTQREVLTVLDIETNAIIETQMDLVKPVLYQDDIDSNKQCQGGSAQQNTVISARTYVCTCKKLNNV